MENIINIINFIRGAEPRNRSIDLVEPVREQIALMKKYNLPGTFLLQYDAMIREDIVSLLRDLDPDQFELGVWLEMNEPHAKAAGVRWHGRPGFEWDWHANAGFSVGYTPAERRALCDAIMTKFDELFHRPVKSVGAWMIDADTLGYLSDRYGIVASCNCKDQWGTDGYTIWGGYWNQGYYPSRKNALCPGQTAEGQIPVPVFRMLGSDPVTQYDLGLKVDEGAIAVQHVASLEPVYGNVGGDPGWVDWFMRQNFEGNSLAFAYAQAGQENSFGWEKMRRGLEYQFPLFAQWRADKGLRLERLCDTGEWYKKSFPLTPAAAVCALEPYGERGAQSVWYDTKNYRCNVYRDESGARLRDLTLFDETRPERYLTDPCVTEYLVYDNLFFMDGNRMSGHGVLAGVYLTGEAGNNLPIGPLSASEAGPSLRLTFDGGEMMLREDGLIVTGGAALCFKWDMARTPYARMEGRKLIFSTEGREYALVVATGRVVDGGQPRILPENGVISLTFDRRR